MKMLQRLCEGHNVQIQEYLQIQSENLQTVDLVSLTVELLSCMSESIDGHTIHLIVQVRMRVICLYGVELCLACRRSTRWWKCRRDVSKTKSPFSMVRSWSPSTLFCAATHTLAVLTMR